MSLHALAGHMASKGRGSDSMLVHMTPEEVQSLQVLALKGGGTLTINPDTGLPEANFLKKMLPMIAGLALAPLTAGTSLAFLGATPLASALTVGGITGLATGSLSRGLMAGLGAYGGASLGAGLAGVGEGAMAASSAPIAENVAGAAIPPIEQLNPSNFGFSAADKLSAGAKAALTDPKSLVTAMGGPLKTFGAAYAAATPMMAGDMVPTTTQMPENTPAYIRPKRFDPYTQQMISYDPILASEFGNRRMSDFTSGDGTPGSAAGLTGLGPRRPAGMAQGGIVALAAGGSPSYFEANPDVAAAYAKDSYGMSPEQFAQTHYELHGQNEQRGNPEPARAGIDAFQIGEGQGAAAAQYLNTNPDVASWLNSAEGKSWAAQNPGYDASDIAYTHYVRYGADEGRKWGAPTPPPPKAGSYGNSAGATPTPGDITTNPDGTVTVHPNIPGRPDGGFTGMEQVRDAYTQGGGSLGYTPYAPATLQEFQERYTNTGGSKQAYDYLMNRGGADVRRPITKTGELMLPYADVMGLRRQIPAGARKPVVEEKEATAPQDSTVVGANGGVTRMALGGLGALAGGGSASQYNLGGYSDGGRLLRGPGDGVSDSIPATIGNKQPARLADGEFVVPARIVSELGNGSTEAGARKLYAMMDRVQKARGKTTGKNRVAANTRSDKYLPA